MYSAFELKIDNDILYDNRYCEYVTDGEDRGGKDKSEVEKYLREVFDDGIIDGTSLSERYFPSKRREVFLSHSHDDEALAYMVAGMLHKRFGLTTFIDSMFWGSADLLLRELDDQYCWQETSQTYNYVKRNFSTAHVHTMLTSAIIKVMDQTEAIIFLNTPSSVPDLKHAISTEGYDAYTQSPWIYLEVLLTQMLKETNLEHYRRQWRFDESVLGHSEKGLQVKYKLPREKLIPLTMGDIDKWYAQYREKGWRISERLNMSASGYVKHPLDVLYELKGVAKGTVSF